MLGKGTYWLHHSSIILNTSILTTLKQQLYFHQNNVNDLTCKFCIQQLHTVAEMYLIHGYYTRIQIKLDKIAEAVPI